MLDSQRLHWLFKRLFDCYGPQYWWPGDSQFAIMVGALLTQNTAWSNVEKAIARLSAVDLLTPEQILSLPLPELAALIRPAGYFNVKARRLHSLCSFLLDNAGIAKLSLWKTDQLRAALLKVHGIGPETADDILLYAFARRIFVVDTFTRRIGSRLGLFDAKAKYDEIRSIFEAVPTWEAAHFNELHAMLVQHAKQACRKQPKCEHCCLADGCLMPLNL